MNESFYQLTPDVVIRAVEETGLRCSGHTLSLNSLENRVYDIGLENGDHVVVKFYRPGRWSREQILEEHEFLFLLKENEIPVVTPLPFEDGRTLHEAEEIYFTVWPRVGGRVPDELSDEELEIIGRTLARIHNAGASKPAVHRITLSRKYYIEYPLRVFEEKDLVPRSLFERYRNSALQVANFFDEISHVVPFHRIHGDCHIGNLLRGDEGWHIVDFDDFLTGPAVQDIWMITPGTDRESLRKRTILLDAYRSFRDFDESWLNLIRPLRAMRWIHYSAWIARRLEDPAFKNAFPHYGTHEYWEQETVDLEEEVELIRSASGDPAAILDRPPDESISELTNRDFFWDWEDS